MPFRQAKGHGRATAASVTAAHWPTDCHCGPSAGNQAGRRPGTITKEPPSVARCGLGVTAAGHSRPLSRQGLPGQRIRSRASVAPQLCLPTRGLCRTHIHFSITVTITTSPCAHGDLRRSRSSPLAVTCRDIGWAGNTNIHACKRPIQNKFTFFCWNTHTHKLKAIKSR